MVDVRGDVLRPPHGTTPAAVKSNIKSEMRSFKSNENIHKKEGGSYYVVSANKAVFNCSLGMIPSFILRYVCLPKLSSVLCRMPKANLHLGKLKIFSYDILYPP